MRTSGGMDEWIVDGNPISKNHRLSFVRIDHELCFDRIRLELAMPLENIHFPKGDLSAYKESIDSIRCTVMQGGQGNVMHWTFNDLFRREGRYTKDSPNEPEYRQLGTGTVELHPLTILPNARSACRGNIAAMPTNAATVGTIQIWQAEKVSIWHPGYHASSFGKRLMAFMISEEIVDTAVPMSLLANHPDVRFHFYRCGVGRVDIW